MKRHVDAWRQTRDFTKVVLLLLAVVVGLAVGWRPDIEPDERPQHDAPREQPQTLAPYDWAALRRAWHKRIELMASRGQLPVFDIESTFLNDEIIDNRFVQRMDEVGVAIIAFGIEARPRWRAALRTLVNRYPSQCMPVPIASLHEHVPHAADADEFLSHTFEVILETGYPTMGEYFFRHYPSNVQQLSNRWQIIDVHIPIDGPYGNRLFAFSQAHDLPFQIHYEVENELLDPLDKMLTRYPGAKVVWCHLGRVRFE